VTVRTLLVVLSLLGFLGTDAAAGPLEMAGIPLGADVKSLAGKLEPGMTETDLDQRYLTTQAMKPQPGYRSGYVTFGNCAASGRVVRVKMNYADESKEFHEKLLGGLKKRYGEPKQWRGSPFGNLRIWKWSVRDPQAGDVSIILQFYSGDDDSFTKGNSLRVSSRTWIREEQLCRRAKQKPEEPAVEPAAPAKPLDLDYFLPK